ncbi:MAG: GNAT family N-acetyltransferase [Lacrimispora celerecrescens]|nr:GNAT family N-acetyltransferase [Lacrimispora celerecrescens]
MGQQEYNIRLLSGDDETDLQDLCQRCSDYFELIEGRPPEKDAANSILFDLPPGKEPKDKYVFGIYKEKGALIGVIDIVKDYKVPGEWIIGLLMIDQKERAKRLGRTLHDLIKTWVSQEHGAALRIGVVEENKGAYKFWEKMGYAELDRVKKNYGNKDQTVIIMHLSLDK